MGLPNVVARWPAVYRLAASVAGAAAIGRCAQVSCPDPMVAALAGGMVLMILVNGLDPGRSGSRLLADRSVHGLIGDGTRAGGLWLEDAGRRRLASGAPWRCARPLCAGMLVMLPLQALMAHELAASSAQVSARLSTIDADYVVLGRRDVPYAADAWCAILPTWRVGHCDCCAINSPIKRLLRSARAIPPSH